MRKIVAGLFQSLDGIVQAPGKPDEDRSGGFEHGGWIWPLFDADVGDFMGEVFARDFDLLLGRRTFDIFAAHWPHVADDPMADKINAATKFVMTSRTGDLGWFNVRPVPDIAALAAVKREDGPDLLVQGSSTIYPALLAEGLIDRLFLITFPVVLGRGKRAFDGAPPVGFHLVDCRISSDGAMIGVYEPGGPVKTGSVDRPDAAEAGAP